ncbi:M57 family metalloprotease [Chitinophaga sp. RAB17]|uniref:M57 family metalloprotease n=1 Tax=Chitinophaga sp. RAB17 TaxID=3233049 RepID=UPI003F8FA739
MEPISIQPLRLSAYVFLLLSLFLFSCRKDVVQSPSPQAAARDVHTEQIVSTFRVADSVAPRITIYVSPLPSAWQTPINQAIQAWNAAGCRIKIMRVSTAANARLVISSFSDTSSQAISTSSFPTSGGSCGPSIRINLAAVLNDRQKTLVIAHELGHCFGFRDTNYSGPGGVVVIPGTPGVDSASVMNALRLPIPEWNGFSFFDIVAFRQTYPSAPGLRTFFRYRIFTPSSGAEYYYYTTNAMEYGPGKDTVSFDGTAGYVVSGVLSGAVPLYCYRSLNTIDRYYTTSNLTQQVGYIYEKSVGLVYSPTSGIRPAGTRALYEYFSKTRGAHYYTVDTTAMGANFKGFVNQGVACYIYY